ncbi:MAG TPA: hypothetical protein VF653_07210 [Methylomirabilota bacterium]
MDRNERARRYGRLCCLTAVTLTILTGCARSWSLADSADQQFRRDALACERDAERQSPTPKTESVAPVGFVHPRADYTMAPGGMPGRLGTQSGTRSQRARLVDICMAAKGYGPDSRHVEQ